MQFESSKLTSSLALNNVRVEYVVIIGVVNVGKKAHRSSSLDHHVRDQPIQHQKKTFLSSFLFERWLCCALRQEAPMVSSRDGLRCWRL